MLLLSAFGYSDVTGITFALLRRFRELVWIGLGLLCLALVGGRQQQFRKVAQTTQELVPDTFFLPRVAPAAPGAGLDRNGIALPGDDRKERGLSRSKSNRTLEKSASATDRDA